MDKNAALTTVVHLAETVLLIGDKGLVEVARPILIADARVRVRVAAAVRETRVAARQRPYVDHSHVGKRQIGEQQLVRIVPHIQADHIRPHVVGELLARHRGAHESRQRVRRHRSLAIAIAVAAGGRPPALALVVDALACVHQIGVRLVVELFEDDELEEDAAGAALFERDARVEEDEARMEQVELGAVQMRLQLAEELVFFGLGEERRLDGQLKLQGAIGHEGARVRCFGRLERCCAVVVEACRCVHAAERRRKRRVRRVDEDVDRVAAVVAAACPHLERERVVTGRHLLVDHYGRFVGAHELLYSYSYKVNI